METPEDLEILINILSVIVVIRKLDALNVEKRVIFRENVQPVEMKREKVVLYYGDYYY